MKVVEENVGSLGRQQAYPRTGVCKYGGYG